MMTENKTKTDSLVVWDPCVRFFHWALVTAFAVSQITAEWLDLVHEYSGYVIFGLIVSRLVWSLVGPKTARFSRDWVNPTAIVQHLKEVITGRQSIQVGHNPAGGAMILVLLVSLMITAVSGYLGQTNWFWGSEWLEEIHEAFGEGLLILVGIHVAAVLIMSLLEKKNLIRAMLTGRFTSDS
jgi:cytochrome b